jgi:hypothetical protein
MQKRLMERQWPGKLKGKFAHADVGGGQAMCWPVCGWVIHHGEIVNKSAAFPLRSAIQEKERCSCPME